MKIPFFLLIVLTTNSCVSNKYIAKKNNGNFDVLNTGKTYIFYHQNDLKTRMEIISIEKDSIIGVKKNNRIALAKNTIWTVRKNNTVGTVVLSFFGAGSALFLTAVALFVNDFGDKD